MTAQLTTADLDAGLQDDRWYGFGYLGERKNFFAHYGMSVVPQIATADRFVLDAANQRGWDADRLIEWACSKNGRLVGEILLSATSPTFTDFLPADAMRRAAQYI